MIFMTIAPLIIYLPVGIYFYFFFRRFLGLFRMEPRWKRTKLLAAAISVAVISCGWRVYGLGAVLILHFFGISVVMEGVNLLVRQWMCRRGIAGEKGAADAGHIWDFLYRSGIITVSLIFVITVYGYFNIRDVRRKEYHIETEKPLSKDLKIIQISDLHMGMIMGAQELEKYCREIGEEKPDVLVLTGDIFDESTTKEEMEDAARILGSVETLSGTYFIFGNHDYNRYRQKKNYTPEELRAALAENNIRVLEDEVAFAGDDLAIVGRKDASVERAAIGELMKSPMGVFKFVLLLDHRPANLAENAAAGVDLQLSGHTHAGQIWPTGQLSSLLGINELNYGHRQIDDFHAIVTSGIAGWGYPIRTGGHSEYVVINVVS